MHFFSTNKIWEGSPSPNSQSFFMRSKLSQYEALKAKYPDALLLFRVGDVYETFNDDAKALQKHLEVVPLSKKKILIASLPFYSLDQTLRVLVKAGYKVAVCEELEDPKMAKRKQKRSVKKSYP